MLYVLKIAIRYLTSSKAQTARLVFGVAIGVFIFIVMSALIGGLAEFIMARTAKDMAHITVRAEAVDRGLLNAPKGGAVDSACARAFDTGDCGFERHRSLYPLDCGLAGGARHLAADQWLGFFAAQRTGKPDFDQWAGAGA
jgi:hypothetical protein